VPWLVITDMTGDQWAGNMMAVKHGPTVIVCTGFSGKIDEEKAGPCGSRGC